MVVLREGVTGALDSRMLETSHYDSAPLQYILVASVSRMRRIIILASRNLNLPDWAMYFLLMESMNSHYKTKANCRHRFGLEVSRFSN